MLLEIISVSRAVSMCRGLLILVFIVMPIIQFEKIKRRVQYSLFGFSFPCYLIFIIFIIILHLNWLKSSICCWLVSEKWEISLNLFRFSRFLLLMLPSYSYSFLWSLKRLFSRCWNWFFFLILNKLSLRKSSKLFLIH